MTTDVTLPVSGMTCGGCENAVRRAVSLLPGVAAVAASHTAGTVRVTFDPAVVQPAAIADKIRALGYAVAP
ncbi:MAG: heavy-metal-associated domain-containing protein [Vicinamibacterales bacterium]